MPRQGLHLSLDRRRGLGQGDLGLAAAPARGGAGDPRQGLVSLWYRAEPPLDRGAAAISPRTGPDPSPRRPRGIIRAQHHARYPVVRGPVDLSAVRVVASPRRAPGAPCLPPEPWNQARRPALWCRNSLMEPLRVNGLRSDFS